MSDFIDFERRGAQFWTSILNEGERVPKIVTSPPKEHAVPEGEEDPAWFFLPVKDVLEATGLPGYWFTDPMTRAAKRIPHLALVGNVRYSLEAIWAWETKKQHAGRFNKARHRTGSRRRASHPGSRAALA